ncbi:MAG TPA: DUF4352 domain-containing protein [Blastocatellia bacterium]|jgi:hypothetical protein|nr:DUF4352 domain-containing protein [Blastocatellia bacterium]
MLNYRDELVAFRPRISDPLGEGIAMRLETLLTFLGLPLALFCIAFALLARRRGIALIIAGGTVIWLGLYFMKLVAVSSVSQERVLSLNQEKRFCGFYFDCHRMVSVSGVRQAREIGAPQEEKKAQGIFYIVTVKVSNDARVAALALESPTAKIVDSGGRCFERDLEAEAALQKAQGRRVAIEQTVGPSSSFTMELVFDLPPDTESPRLFISEGDRLSRLVELFVIGDEDSLYHKKTFFSLDPAPGQSGPLAGDSDQSERKKTDGR